MIGTIEVRVTAGHPEIPLAPKACIKGSAVTIGVLDVPRRRGELAVGGVEVTIVNAAGTALAVSATLFGGVWTATFPPDHFADAGEIGSGLTISATGTDERGEAVDSWTLGVGDFAVLEADGTPRPGESWTNVHLRDEEPEAPRKGDLARIGGVWKIFDGEEWLPLGSGGVSSVNGRTGAVVLGASDVGADAAGTARAKDDLAVYAGANVSWTISGFPDTDPFLRQLNGGYAWSGIGFWTNGRTSVYIYPRGGGICEMTISGQTLRLRYENATYTFAHEGETYTITVTCTVGTAALATTDDLAPVQSTLSAHSTQLATHATQITANSSTIAALDTFKTQAVTELTSHASQLVSLHDAQMADEAVISSHGQTLTAQDGRITALEAALPVPILDDGLVPVRQEQRGGATLDHYFQIFNNMGGFRWDYFAGWTFPSESVVDTAKYQTALFRDPIAADYNAVGYPKELNLVPFASGQRGLVLIGGIAESAGWAEREFSVLADGTATVNLTFTAGPATLPYWWAMEGSRYPVFTFFDVAVDDGTAIPYRQTTRGDVFTTIAFPFSVTSGTHRVKIKAVAPDKDVYGYDIWGSMVEVSRVSVYFTPEGGE